MNHVFVSLALPFYIYIYIYIYILSCNRLLRKVCLSAVKMQNFSASPYLTEDRNLFPNVQKSFTRSVRLGKTEPEALITAQGLRRKAVFKIEVLILVRDVNLYE